jgi:hypothetical protein
MFCTLLTGWAALSGPAFAADATLSQFDRRFSSTVKPFLQTYCVSCHGGDKPEADMDLSAMSSVTDVVKDGRRLGLLIDRLDAEEMPPKKAKLHPSAEARRQVVACLQEVHDYEARHNAGDPGIVLARRLSNAEYNYTIRDLTGVDIQPTREFPEDPSSSAGFDNSGESLVMSPSLLGKYLKAAREVASYMYLKRTGTSFSSRGSLICITGRTPITPTILRRPGVTRTARRWAGPGLRWPILPRRAK